ACSSFELLPHFITQYCWLDHFHMRSVSHDVHHQLARIAIRNTQLVSPILEMLALLLRMPVLIRNPARALRRKAQHSDFVRLAAEDAVRARVVTIEIGIRQIERSVFKHFRATQAIERERSQLVALLVPGIEIPGLAIVRETLRRNRALRLSIATARVIFEPEL